MLWKAHHGRTSSRSEARGWDGKKIAILSSPPFLVCNRLGAPSRQGPVQGVPPRMGRQGKRGAMAAGYRWSGLGAESGEQRPESTVGEGDWVDRNKSPSTRLSPVSSFGLMDSEGTCSRQGLPLLSGATLWQESVGSGKPKHCPHGCDVSADCPYR